MSFGPKLKLPARIPRRQEVLVTLRFVPKEDGDCQREGDIYVEDFDGLRTLTIRTRGAE